MRLQGVGSSTLGDFGEQWLRVLASGAGLLNCNPDSRDLIRGDVSVTYDGQLGGTESSCRFHTASPPPACSTYRPMSPLPQATVLIVVGTGEHQRLRPR